MNIQPTRKGVQEIYRRAKIILKQNPLISPREAVFQAGQERIKKIKEEAFRKIRQNKKSKRKD
jgi:hypothetical protein